MGVTLMSTAAKHYQYYPTQESLSPVWAYGFRPFFLLLPWYIALITLLWGLGFSEIIPMIPFGDPLLWHVYELLYGVGFAGIAAFLLTGLPELFPGVIPIVGRKLQWLVALYLLGRITFWTMGLIGIYPAMLLNLAFSLALLLWAFKPVVLDPLQRHASLAYTILWLTLLQGAFFASILGWIETPPLSWLYLALGGFMVLILLALRRVQTEAINELMEDQKREDLFVARPYRYNLAIFSVLLFSAVEFWGETSTSGWLALASSAAILAIINDFHLRFERIFWLPYVLFFTAIFGTMAGGYALLGVSYLFELPYLSQARHLLTVGAWGGSFLMVMLVVGFVHTGRRIVFDWLIGFSIWSLLFSVLIRFASGTWIEGWGYGLSALLFALSFILYYYRFKNHLRHPRADGIAG